ncbi:MAG: RNA 2',3'-cyclic phosphodiesterase [Candidatus Hydrogenedentes bacterium]|nr:RNA 2',3'-cyclic phosphodiesterase [Candidatus Hydrogenedentota bacterium]
MSVQDGYRAFIALNLPEDVKGLLYNSVLPVMRELKSEVKWVALDNLHLTLRFIGHISNSKSDLLREKMRRLVQNYTDISFNVGGVGVFPSWKEPRVLWVGLIPVSGNLIQLQSDIENVVQSLDFPPERQRFHPHVTLGRVKSITPAVKRAWGKVIIPEIPSFSISKVTLFKSSLLPSGAVYDKVEEFLLLGES